MSSPQSIPDTQLGLTSSEIQILRQHQAIALQNQNVSRGRGNGRGSTSSSRAASAASSHGRLLLDPGSLAALAHHFDRLMAAISGRVDALTAQTQLSTQAQYDRAGNAMAVADAEIARFKEILRQIDELEVEFDKVRRIREIVKGFRSRVEGLEKRVESSGSRRR
ncbi:MAG: hypothetical protein M1834_009310 [Cirrosporium novae-zelandiae]|nr:MAG: hypothetical protein M1834_009310 [Cirrosporium novae-zelandiae]